MGQAEIEIPETWDTVKYEKPIYPTCSRGKFGQALYCNNKYHCYGVQHELPFYNLTPYRPTGFGFGEKSLRYVPLTHIVDRTTPPSLKPAQVKYEARIIYESAMDTLRFKRLARDDRHVRKIVGDVRERNSKNWRLLADAIVGQTRYRTHKINQLVAHYHE
jgi:hypothetical protein